MMEKRFEEAKSIFEDYFGEEEMGNLSFYSSPGRTEIGGNHTDHQHGEVLAAALDIDTIAVVRRSNSNMIRIQSEGYPPFEVDINDVDEPKPQEKGRTKALIRGVIKYLKDRDYRITGGFDAYVTSDVEPGSGLSSSASFEVLIGTIVSGEFNDSKIEPEVIAKAGQYAENLYFGKPCGLMDQMACAIGGVVHIDFRNLDKPVVKRLDFDLLENGLSLCITNTGGSHSDLTDEYKSVTDEMKSVADILKTKTTTLLDVTADDIYTNIDVLRREVGDRAVLRALHFIDENQRVRREAEAIRLHDIELFLQLINDSGNSSYKYLQNVYVAANPKSQNVALALAVTEEFIGRTDQRQKAASRVHGGGFAGTIQTFISSDKAEEYKKLMDRIFGEDSCQIVNIRQQGGIKVEFHK
ncbi:MAG: galactokinase [Clostridia bacterium]|nr:galactokinase [Clostridia bacterium]